MGQALFAGTGQRDGGTCAGSPGFTTNDGHALAVADGSTDASALCGAPPLLWNWQFHLETPTHLVRDSPGANCHGRFYGYRISRLAPLPVLLERSGSLDSVMVCLARHDHRHVRVVVL